MGRARQEAEVAGNGSAQSLPPAAPSQPLGKFHFSTGLVQTNEVCPPPKFLQAKYTWKKLVVVELRHSIPAACQSSLFPGFSIIFLLKPL